MSYTYKDLYAEFKPRERFNCWWSHLFDGMSASAWAVLVMILL